MKPTQVYGFESQADREPPIELNIMHLDFRGELPAFDKYFYFPDPQHLAKLRRYPRKRHLRREYRKQDYLRQRSKRLRSLIDTDGVQLSDVELRILCYILHREYEGGVLLQHDLFHGHTGWTVLFRTREIGNGYSEAFAGSGESAAALMVHRVLSAEPGSMILLDEPETSLHPGAQERMLEFLTHQAARKSLQIVMATHSLYLANPLPPSAIRVLEVAPNQRIRISTDYSAREALLEMGSVPPGKAILVEDKRAKHLVLSALKKVGGTASRAIQIVVLPGGTSRIFRDILAYANSGRSDIYVVLDGDHKPATPSPGLSDLPQGSSQLGKIINEITRGPNKSGPPLNFTDTAERTRFVKFAQEHLRYLPGDTPESLVWDEVLIQRLLGDIVLPVEVIEAQDAKTRLELLAKAKPGLTAESIFEFLVSEFIHSDRDELNDLVATIDYIRQA